VTDIKTYLQYIDRSRNDKHLDTDIYDNTVDYIDYSYRVGVVQSLMRDNNFYSRLPPDLKLKLCFSLLQNYYNRFYFFFNDLEQQNFADQVFTRKLLTNLDC
jgi:hypothetical protein